MAYSPNRRSILSLALGGAVTAAASQRVLAADKKVITIGYPKAGPLIVLSKLGRLEKRLASSATSVNWREFTSGVQALEAMAAQAIDFAMTGDSPIIFAQANGTPLRYVAYEPSAPESQGILVLKESPIARFEDLRGKRIAVQRGSNCHFLAVAALKRAGLKPSDVEFAYMTAPDGRAALAGRNVDAYAIWDPLMTATIAGGARLLINGNGLSNNRFYYSATPALAANRALLTVLVEEIGAAGRWINDNRQEAANILSPATGLPAGIWEQALEHSTFGAKWIEQEPLEEQQRIADAFLEIGLLSKSVRVADIALLS
jgi:sulfonate transport system substrate-binding protein